MYLDFFQLSRRPFSQVPAANGYILVPSLKRELNRCLEAIEECRCPLMIAGPSGCGKSVLVALIENHFSREIRTVKLDCASITNRLELIQGMLGEMGLRFGSESMGELRLRMIDFLKSGDHCPNGLLLLVDEAQNLTDEVLEELRLMTNLVCSGRSQVRLVLAGNLSLEENVARRESFNQRITTRCYPGPLSINESMVFVLAQMQMAGRDGREIFQPSALQKIHSMSGGIPRVICQIGDNALRCAAVEKRPLINAATIEAAWYDLQQLPAPADQSGDYSHGTKSGQDSVIEYGSLTDEPVNRHAPYDLVNESHCDAGQPQYSVDEVETPVDAENCDREDQFDSESVSHANVDATLTDLLRQLDDFDIPGESMPATSSESRSRGSGDTTGVVEPNAANPSKKHAGPGPKAVDSATVFGRGFDQEEKVVDIQSLRLSGQNRTAARTSVDDVSGIADSDSSPAWLPVGNEIVIPTIAEQQSDERQIKVSAGAKSQSTERSVGASRRNDRKSDKKTKMPEDSSDDRDMFVLQESSQSTPDDGPATPPTQASPSNITPAGSAKRMDYQALFRQLRQNMDVDH